MAAETPVALSTAHEHAESFAPQRLRWLRGAGFAALIALYGAFWGATGLFNINLTDFDVFFLPSARVALAGHPLLIYSVRYLGIYPNANGPLSLLPLTLITAVAQHLGWLDDVYHRRMLVMAAFSIFALLMAREALRAVERFTARPLAPYQRGLVFAFFALSPELWHAVLLYGHIELPILLALVLAATRLLARRRYVVAGILFGLALLTRSMAVLYLIPLALLLLRRRRWRECAVFLGAAGVVVALGILPFWLADRADVLYSLVTFRASLPLGGGSFWQLFPDTPLYAFGLSHDSIATVALALIVALAALVSRPDMEVGSREVYGLLALSGLCFALTIKSVWPYYFLDAYVFLGVFWLAGLGAAQRAESRPAWLRWWLGAALPLAAVGLALLSENGAYSGGSGLWSPLATALMTAATLALALGIGFAVWSSERNAPPEWAGPHWLMDFL
ncbi:MAG: glycosyltransferase 87 family protein [Ktedonobacterales bacterium]